MYAVSGAGGAPSQLYTVNPLTGATTLVGAIGFSHVTGLAIDPTSGQMYGCVSDIFGTGDVQLISINKNTGAGTLIGNTGHQIPDMSFRSDGQLFGWSEMDPSETFVDVLVSINKFTGAATPIGTSTLGTANTGFGASPNGTLLLKNFDLSMHSVNPITGETTFLTTLSGDGFSLHNILLMQTDTQGFSVGRRAGTSFLYNIDLNTSTYTEIGDMGVSNISALALDIAPIPEPGTLVLLGLAGTGTVMVIKKRRGKRRSKKAKK